MRTTKSTVEVTEPKKQVANSYSKRKQEIG
jgi:hypothetical protein